MQLVGNRYQLHEQLGSGGMGIVYRATDRLNRNEPIALKQVFIHPNELMFNSRIQEADIHLMLAHEFQMLASLHHPHIISVLDYGFDPVPESNTRRPFFTMTLLDNPRSILEAAEKCSFAEKITLLMEMLQALAYLHRRDIIHRDLKPGNVLVGSDGRVRVVDFGLAVDPQQAKGIAGTLPYIAPEVLQTGRVTKAADLYAAGIIMYEMFAGQHPFDIKNTNELIQAILQEEPDLTRLDTETLRPVISRLLSKIPQQRYATAEEVMAELSAIQPVPVESVAIRESFLQSARFVGREHELATLTDALAQSRGSAWLIGGESGVGKSRLMEELRIRALVSSKGVLVLRGKAIETGSLPYQLWRSPLRQLVLSTPLSDLEAGILKDIVPDISSLLERPVPDAPPLTGAERRQRLVQTIVEVFRRQQQPILLLLEDLQWVTESLEPLKALLQIIEQLPLLIVASYRDDERLTLPAELPGMQVMKLNRLDSQHIAQLTESMLGEAGQDSEVLTLLERETEGNVFFLVETVRVLAEEAGSLSRIGIVTLPEAIFSGGMEEVIKRRLGRVAPKYRPLLKLAAVAGRYLDLTVLRTFNTNLETWLHACANAAVLEMNEGQWRFAHDKIRTGLLHRIPEEEIPVLHRQVAEAIEGVYPGHLHASALYDHWRRAGDIHKQAYYAAIEAERDYNNGSFPDTYTLLEDTLSGIGEKLTPAEKLPLLTLMGDVCYTIGKYDRAIACYQEALAISPDTPAAIEIGLANVAMRQGQFDTAETYYSKVLNYAETAGDKMLIGKAAHGLAGVYYMRSDMAAALNCLQKAAAVRREIQDVQGLSGSLNNLALLSQRQGDFETARQALEESLAIARQTDNRYTTAFTLHNLGFLEKEQGNMEAARAYLEESLHLKRAINEHYGITVALHLLCIIAYEMGDFAAAQIYGEESFRLRKSSGDQQNISSVLSELARVARYQGNHTQAKQYLAESLSIARQVTSNLGLLDALYEYALLHYKNGDYPAAKSKVEELLTEAEQVTDPIIQNVGQHLMGMILLTQGQPIEARSFLQQALQIKLPIYWLQAILGWAALHLAEGNPQEAAELAGWVKRHPAGRWMSVKDWLDPLMTRLRGQLPENELSMALERCTLSPEEMRSYLMEKEAVHV